MVVRCRSTRRRMRGVGSITRRRRQGGSSTLSRLSFIRRGAKPKSERQPGLRKALVAYPIFWSFFISDFIDVLETSPRFSNLMKYLDRETFRQPIVLLKLRQTFDANEFVRFGHLKAQDLAFVEKQKEWTQTHIRSLTLTMKSASPETESSPLKCSDFLDIVKLRWKAKPPSYNAPSNDIIQSQIQTMTDYVSGLHEAMLMLQSRQPTGEVDDALSETAASDSMVNAGDINMREKRSAMGKTNKRGRISRFARGVVQRFFPFAMAEKQVQKMIELLQSDICEKPHIILAELVSTLVSQDSHYTLFSTAFKENAVVRKLPDIIKNEAWLINDDILANSRFDDTQHINKNRGGGCMECIGVQGDCCEDFCIPIFCPCCDNGL